MNLFLFDKTDIITFSLPSKKIGNFWMTDLENNNLVNIVAEDNNWKIGPSKHTKIFDSKGNTENIVLKAKSYYAVEYKNTKMLLYCDYLSDITYKSYMVKDNSKINIGSDVTCDVKFNLSIVNKIHIIISYANKKWSVSVTEGSLCYLNDKAINGENISCRNGDIITIYNYKILLVYDKMFINDPFNNNTCKLDQTDLIVNETISNEEIDEIAMYDDNDYFLASPRIIQAIDTYKMVIDSPPAQEKLQDTPLWVTLAPMLTMAASSAITLSNALQALNEGTRTFRQSIPSFVICLSILCTTFVWPFFTKKFQKKQKIEKENERQLKYQKYIDGKDKDLAIEFERQKRALEENTLSTDICYDTIINKRRTLWSRRIDQNDFLSVRVGRGTKKFDADISYHSEDFSMDDDNLKEMLNKLINNYTTIENVPVTYSFVENILTGINGMNPRYVYFMNNLILQLMAFHNYNELKIAVFTNKNNAYKWEYIKESPFCFNDDKSLRLFATNAEEMQEISVYLQGVYDSRKVLSTNGNNQEKINDFSKFFGGYYLIIIDDIDLARKKDVINDIIENKNNLGFSLVILEEKLSKVPSEVSKFIVIGEKTATILDTTNNDQIKFNEEIIENYDMKLCSKLLSNVPIRAESETKRLPDSISFLELFGVGKIEQLNILNRWKNNNPTKSLRAEIGIDSIGEMFTLDLHEKFHGPHGLIAGMTGSGKSEFIISYVLSMAINYSPEEVQFVLIDYKGGGLAGAFFDPIAGNKIPHVVGTITNLDKTEINRALASINSELRRRQTLFSEVRDKLGESTIDIYKYQKLYREGVIDEPISHLIIVCDEFAELKDQQPDFMNDLVSTARIGRSLGVHLILATQKPSGVVDSQIWSNSKFKVCLKVQDKQDSMEMIRNDLAAELKNVGRFYLLVGYNEFFSIGQAAWAGAQYYPNNEFRKTVDKNLYLIDNIGYINKTIGNSISRQLMSSQGEELTNIVKYIIGIGNESSFKINKLWLDSISNNIFIEDIVKKYNYKKENFVINPVIGEYDDPENQKQDIFTLNISSNGNTIVYGMNESGKDEFLQTVVYSLLDNYSPQEINLYLLDFGAETLMNYIDAPQVGDIVLSTDEEKIINLSKYLISEIDRRKKLFSQYGGSYYEYNKSSGKPVPNVIIVINSIEIMIELYENIIEKYSTIIRDGNKYGIYFIITTENANSIKMKISQSCKNILTLQLSNESMYRDILGKTNGLVPSNYIGRGLMKAERVCEFQTAFIASPEEVYTKVKGFVSDLKVKYTTKAPAINIMPETIKFEKISKDYSGLNKVPIGIIKESLQVASYDFSKKPVSIISSVELDNSKIFINNLIYSLSKNNKFKVEVIDASNYLEEFNFPGLGYVFNNLNEEIDKIEKDDNKMQELLLKDNMNFRNLNIFSNTVYVIIGFEKFFNKLDDEHKNKFKTIINNNKEYAKINFIVIDVPSNFKKYEYEDWYKQCVDTNNGVWIGAGLSQQFVLKVSIQLAYLSNITNEYGVIVKNGIPSIFKILNEIKK